MKSLALIWPEWLKLDCPRCSGPWPRSRIRLENIEIGAHARWIKDIRSIHFIDWLSSSGANSEIKQLRLDDLMLIDDNVIAAVGRMICAAQASVQLEMVMLSLGPEVDLTPRECCVVRNDLQLELTKVWFQCSILLLHSRDWSC